VTIIVERKRDVLGRFVSAKSREKKRAKKKTTKKRQKKSSKQTTHVAFLLDNSGSMFPHRTGAKKAFNSLIKTIKDESKDQVVLASYYTFGVGAKKIFFEFKAKTLKNLDKYDPYEYRTALYEAIVTAIDDFKGLPDVDNENSSFLVLVVTDGLENKHNYGDDYVKKIIQDCHATDRWTFGISCPERYVSSIATKLGIPIGNIHGWDQYSALGMQDVNTAHSEGLRSYLGQRSLGVTSTKNYFVEINVGRKGVKSITMGLVADDSKRFRRLKVDKARGIKDFIDSKKLKFEKGRVFYSLAKPEIVQHYKEIVLQKRDNPKTFYGGSQVRDKLSIPHGQNGKVTPGNLGEWVIWIQSTSSNRKLLAKMEVLYDTSNVVNSGPPRKH